MNIAIIGGGASGLMAGIVALKNGAKVDIFEKNNKLGKKILASGNGRCNITNKHINIKNYHSTNPNFAHETLKNFDFYKCEEFFKTLGIYLTTNQNKCFPLSLQSSSIVDILTHEIKNLNANIHLNTKILNIEKKECFYLKDEKNRYKADKVLLSCGSCAMQKLGGTHSGYELAKSLKHDITPLYPSLVQLICKEDYSFASGVKFKGLVRLRINHEEVLSVTKDVLITNYGISGSAILDISRIVAKNLHKFIQIIIDTLPDFSKQKIAKTLNELIKNCPNREIYLSLNAIMNKKLAILVLKNAHINKNILAKNLSQKQIKSIIYHLKNLTYTPIDTKGFDNSEVVSGGVDTTQIDAKTLQSKIIKDLYFSGEIIDIDGDCGGYNLHWAWASGIKCGLQMTKNLQNLL